MTIVEKLETDPQWSQGRHGSFYRQISPNVMLVYWISSDTVSVQEFKRRGKRPGWTTVKDGVHPGRNLANATYHAERIAADRGEL